MFIAEPCKVAPSELNSLLFSSLLAPHLAHASHVTVRNLSMDRTLFYKMSMIVVEFFLQTVQRHPEQWNQSEFEVIYSLFYVYFQCFTS